MAELVTFTFADTNPATGQSYARTRFAELPGFAADVVAGKLAFEPGEWDVLVADDEAFDFTGENTAYPIPGSDAGEIPAALLAPRVVPEDVIGVIG